MTPTEPGYNAAELRNMAKMVQRSGNFMKADPASILALLAEIERLTGDSKAQGATIRELEDENVELNDELGTAVQVLKLERDGLRARLAAVEATPGLHLGYAEYTPPGLTPEGDRAALAEPTSNEPQSGSKFDAPGPDPDGGVDLTDEEFAAFLKAAKS